jgi:hypothetical protein
MGVASSRSAGGLLLTPEGELPTLRLPPGYAEEGTSISIKALQPTASSVRSYLASASGSG